MSDGVKGGDVNRPGSVPEVKKLPTPAMTTLRLDPLVVRPFVAADWIGAIIACPHCGRLLKCIKAEGPYVGHDPSEHWRSDLWWRLTLEDGADTRMWEDRKGIIVSGRTLS